MPGEVEGLDGLEPYFPRVARAYLTVARPIQTTVAGPELVDAARKERPGLFEVVSPI